MIIVTERAKDALLELKRSANLDQADVGLRLAPATGGELGLYADRRKAGDQVVEHEGSTVLLIGEEISKALVGTTIDCRRTPDGARLVLARSASDNGGAG